MPTPQTALRPRANPPGRKKGGGSFQSRALPLLLLAALSLYGGWFLSRAMHSRPGSDHIDIVDEADGPVRDEDDIRDQQPVEEIVKERQALVEHAAAAKSQHSGGTMIPLSGVCNATSPSPKALALKFLGKQFLELSTSDDAQLDTRELTLSAWVRLPSSSGGWPSADGPASIQTLMASKASGCDANENHYGIALFVNAWNSDSGQLYLSWGNGKSGCEELATTGGKWAFVAATIDGEGAAALYVNGMLKAHTGRTPTLGTTRISGGQAPIERGVSHHSLRIGAHTDDTHFLRGSLTDVAVHPRALDGAEQLQLMCSRHAELKPPPLALVQPSSAGGSSRKLNKLTLNVGGGGRSEISVDAMSEPPGALRVGRENDKYAQPAVTPVADISASSRSSISSDSGSDLLSSTKKRGNRGAGGHEGVAGPQRVVSAQSQEGGSNLGASHSGWPIPWLPGKAFPRPDPAVVNASDAISYARRDQVRGVMRRAWDSYRKYAWGADELKPVSNRSHDWLKLGATLVDCLDNLWIMGMKEEFAEARQWVATRLSFSTSRGVSMFETTIRILGGLLSAYELSKDKIFLTKGQELADKMMFAFDKNPRTGLPCTTINLGGGTCTYASWTGNAAILAEFGTIQLEYKYLAYHTGEIRYWNVVERIMGLMRKVDKPHGLYPVFMSPNGGSWTSQKITLGALGDSFYEYLIKQWLITKKKEPYLREMFDSAMLSIARKLVQRSSPSGFVYIADWSGAALTHKMDHLACFAGAMYAVGAQDGGQYDNEYMALAEALGETCYKMYANTVTGLSPEFVQFVGGRDMATPRQASYNIGRPEAVETWFYMWYYTRDPKWREMGWRVFEAFEKYASTGSGWTALPDVDNPRRRDDKMESFVLAETVKYMYLLFDPDYPIPLEKYVFNTEAHPLGHIEPMTSSST